MSEIINYSTIHKHHHEWPQIPKDVRTTHAALRLMPANLLFTSLSRNTPKVSKDAASALHEFCRILEQSELSP